MKAYHNYIREALLQPGEAFAIDINTEEYFDRIGLENLGLLAAMFAVQSTFNGGNWDGRARVLHTRHAISGGTWYLVRDIKPSVPCGLPRIALYTPLPGKPEHLFG